MMTMAMKNTTITLHTGDCLTAPWRSKRNAWFPDTPALVKFMGREWDWMAPDASYIPPLSPRNKKHLIELQREWAFQRYWGERFGMMYDQSEDDAVAFVWALPRTAHLTQTALRWAGWRILDSWHHAFGQGWNKNGGHLKPAHEVWFVALKGKPELNIDAGRVARGGSDDQKRVRKSGEGAFLGSLHGADATGGNALGSHPPNFALSHHPSCMRIGERKVKGGTSVNHNCNSNEFNNSVAHGKIRKSTRDMTYTDGTGLESLPAFSCAVSCPCGRHWIEPSGGSPGMCECGRQGEWVCPVAELDEQSGISKDSTVDRAGITAPNKIFGAAPKRLHGVVNYGGEGGASRFFPTFGYYAKASGRIDDAEVKRLEKLEKKRAKATDPIEIARLDLRIAAQQKIVSEADNAIPRGERHAGCEELYWCKNEDNPFGFDRITRDEWLVHTGKKARGNVHPTVKSIEMMMYLAKLSGGTKIGDLCFGSGGTAIACQLLGLDFEGAELCPEAVEITNARLAFWSGLSFSALEQFKLTGTLPTNSDTSNVGNLSLFD